MKTLTFVPNLIFQTDSSSNAPDMARVASWLKTTLEFGEVITPNVLSKMYLW